MAIPQKVLERLTKEVKRFQDILKRAKDRDVNEADTVVIITDMLSNIFGYDKLGEEKGQVFNFDVNQQSI